MAVVALPGAYSRQVYGKLPPFPPFMEIMNGLARLVARHPSTTFIGAHVGAYVENLGWVSDLLDRCPNFQVDLSDSIAELGRQPRTARRFFLRHADRILFGTDLGRDPEMSRIYYRFLETADEYFNPDTGGVPRQGRWHISGVNLPGFWSDEPQSGRAKATMLPPAGRPDFPPPAEITTYCLPSIM